MRNFPEIYGILYNSLYKCKKSGCLTPYSDDQLAKSLKSFKLIKQHRHEFWENSDEIYYDKKTYYHQYVDNIFRIKVSDIDKLVDLVIMPSLEV